MKESKKYAPSSRLWIKNTQSDNSASNYPAPSCGSFARDGDGGRALLNAAKEGNAKEVQELLKCPDEVDVNHTDYYHQTSLWWASSSGYLPVVELLLNDSRIDVNGERRAPSTPLYMAVRQRYLDVVQALLAHPQGGDSIKKLA